MTPSDPHSRTRGTGEYRTMSTAVLRLCGQDARGPRLVALQSKACTRRASSPPGFRPPGEGCAASGVSAASLGVERNGAAVRRAVVTIYAGPAPPANTPPDHLVDGRSE